MGDTFKDGGFFLLRTPLFPFSTLTEWLAGANQKGSDSEGEERRGLRGRTLPPPVSRPIARDAIYLASPGLHSAIERWDDTSPESVVVSATRYLSRMCARPTPFGLFAGCSVGEVGRETKLHLSNEKRRHTRLDSNYIFVLANVLERQLRGLRCLEYFVNSSLYLRGCEYRYIETTVNIESMERRGQTVAIGANEIIESVLRSAERGASHDHIVSALLNAFPDTIQAGDAEPFVDQLIDAQILVSDLIPPLTANSPLSHIISRLEAEAEVAKVLHLLEPLRSVRDSLEELSFSKTESQLENYEQIVATMKTLPVDNTRSVLQVDLYKPCNGLRLTSEVTKEALRGAELLAQLCPQPPNPALERFKRRFAERYDRKEVPLLEALDEESGIGFDLEDGIPADDSPLLEGLTFPTLKTTQSRMGAREAWLCKRIQDCLRDGANRWNLTAEDIDTLRVDSPGLPNAFSTLVSLVASSAEDVDRGQYQLWIRSVAGPAGVNGMGRFCFGDQGLRDRVEAHIAAEEQAYPDAICAEIVYLPVGRTTNVVCRPSIRRYEIPFLAPPGVSVDYQIPVQDLMLSASRGRLRLASKRLGRAILPRMTNAHWVSDDEHPVYRFLVALRGDGRVAGARWDWGPFQGLSFLPRVTSERSILSEAMWVVAGHDLAVLARGASHEKIAKVKELRERLDWPRWVAVGERDQKLVVDLDNDVSILSGLREASHIPALRVTEWLLTTGSLCVSQPDGAVTNEILIPFLREGTPPPEVPTIGRPSIASVTRDRTFLPGSEWVSFKIYLGAATADQFLKDAVAPLVDYSTSSGIANRWFFIRFPDPHWHLRLRFQGEPAGLMRDLVIAAEQSFRGWIDQKLVWRVEIDTYEREIERYGGTAGVCLAEELFEADSAMVLSMLRETEDTDLAARRVELALVGVDDLLRGLGLEELSARLDTIEGLRKAFRAEFRVDTQLARQLGQVYRERSGEIASLLAGDLSSMGGIERIGEALERRRDCIRRVGRRLRGLQQDGTLSTDLSALARSFIHMNLNRVLRSDQRRQELVIYDLLARQYMSLIARSKRESSMKS